MLTFEFTGVEGRMTESEILTSGMVGKTVQLLFDDSWTNFAKTVVFRSGEICRTADGADAVVTIPEDVLARPFRKLHVGVYGTDEAGTLVIPTVMAEGPLIRYGADPTEDPEGEDLPVWKNLQEQIGDLTLLKTDDRSSLVAAINENHRNLELLAQESDRRQAQLGQLSELQTAAKDSLVAAINEIHAELQQPVSDNAGLSETAAALLIEILRHAIYEGDQTAAIDALEAALGLSSDDSGSDATPEEPIEPEVTLTGLSAAYSGGDVPVGTDVTELDGITVTAHYSDGSSQTVTDYALSGAIAEGSNTVTVSYEGFTAAFTVTGVAEEPEVVMTGISASYSGGDVAVGTALSDLTGITVTAHYSDGSNLMVEDFILSGTIAEGENTVTVTYEGHTATFTVTGVAEEPEVVMTGISATYSGGDVAVGTALSDLTGITVTAHYSDGISMMLEDFDLSGTIAEGENTITVTYEGHTATFTVTGIVKEAEVDQTETLELVYTTSYPNVTTFAYTEQASAGNYAVAKRGNLAGGVLSVAFDETIATNWNLNLYVFDADGNPYLQTDKTSTTGADLKWGGTVNNEPKWEAVGAGAGFATVLAPFTIQLPAGCSCIACIRAGSSGVSNFTTWAKNGGITFTVTTYK